MAVRSCYRLYSFQIVSHVCCGCLHGAIMGSARSSHISCVPVCSSGLLKGSSQASLGEKACFACTCWDRHQRQEAALPHDHVASFTSSETRAPQGDQGHSEGIPDLGSCFGLEWRRLYDLPYPETDFLRNPLNEDKPVKISRDGQELPPDIGQELVRLFEEGAERAGVPRPGQTCSFYISSLSV